MKKWSKSILVSFTIICSSVYVSAPFSAQANTSSIEMTKKKQQIDQQIKKLDKELTQLHNHLQQKVKQFKNTQSDILDVKHSITETEKRMSDREKLLNERMIAYQEQESVIGPYLEVMLGADSLSDLLSRAISVKTIIDADKDLLDQQQQDKTELEEQQQKLLQKKNDLQQQFQEMQEQEKEMEVKQLENKAQSLKLKEQIATKKQQEKLEKERLVKEKEVARLKVLAEKEFLQQQALVQKQQAEAEQQRALVQKQQAEAEQQQIEERESISTETPKPTDTESAIGQAGNAGNGSNGGEITDANQQAPTVKGDEQAKAVIAEASKYLGTSYVWGGSTPASGFDCSGLTQWSFKKAGVAIPRTAAQQYLAAKKIEASEATAGDVVFFSYGKGVAHVGIYLGDGRMLDAQNNGVVVESMDWWNKYLVGYGRF